MVSLRRRRDSRELPTLGPVELSSVDDDSCNSSAMSSAGKEMRKRGIQLERGRARKRSAGRVDSHPFGRTVNNDIGSVIEGSDEVASGSCEARYGSQLRHAFRKEIVEFGLPGSLTKRIIDDERNVVFVSESGELGKVRNVPPARNKERVSEKEKRTRLKACSRTHFELPIDSR